MNTSKQVNVMIGLLFIAFAVFGAYIVNEPNRAARAEERQDENLIHRGAILFMNNCRTCHGLTGLGPDEGALAPKLNNPAFLILGEDNEYGLEPTPEGEVRGIRNFLFNTIACGRAGTAMPVWSERYGGPLSDTQINYLVDMITSGELGWGMVEEVGLEHDEETLHAQVLAHEAAVEAYENAIPQPTGEPPGDPPTLESVQGSIVLSDASALSLTQENCGQYNGITALPFRTRDPFAAATPAPGETAEPGETQEPGGGGPEDAMVQGVPIDVFFQASCSACHGADRAGLPGLGLPLTPSALTEPDEFYFDTIANGRAGTVMPSWRAAGLTDDEINALVQFIKNVEP